jgi:hypothetical protein
VPSSRQTRVLLCVHALWSALFRGLEETENRLRAVPNFACNLQDGSPQPEPLGEVAGLRRFGGAVTIGCRKRGIRGVFFCELGALVGLKVDVLNVRRRDVVNMLIELRDDGRVSSVSIFAPSCVAASRVGTAATLPSVNNVQRSCSKTRPLPIYLNTRLKGIEATVQSTMAPKQDPTPISTK